MKTAAVIAVGGLALLSAGGVKADDNKYCVTEARATDIIRLWGYELGETNLKNVQVCDKLWWKPTQLFQTINGYGFLKPFIICLAGTPM